ncbi:MAG: ATP-binding cassette domain-containing protein, partial [Roseburia sp.]|nr:ATP-binding cassette domain-containing protein [Roseburia sp.]
VLKNVSQKYKNKVFLNIENLSFPFTGCILIKGPNGSGKTTLLRTILGLLPYNGQILFQNSDIKVLGNDLFKRVCYVPQFNVLFNELTLEENLKLNNEFLSQDLKEFPKTKKIKKLSGGQQKSANLERGLFFDFDCFILDEPTVSLDKNRKQELFSFINQFKKDKLIICVSHDEQVEEYADQIIEMNTQLSLNNEIMEIEQNYNKSSKTKVPFKIFIKILLEDKFIFFFKMSITFALLLLSVLLIQMFTFSKEQMEEIYTKNIMKYSYIESNDSLESVYELYSNENSFFDMVGFKYMRSMRFEKDKEIILKQIKNVYFSKAITDVIVSDFLFKQEEDISLYSLIIDLDNEERHIDNLRRESTKQNLFNDMQLKEELCSYIVFPSSYIDTFDDYFLKKLNFVISSQESLPTDYHFAYSNSNYASLFQSVLFPKIFCIAALIIFVGIYLYIELVQIYQRKNKAYLDEKLRIFGAPSPFLSSILLLREIILTTISLIFSSIIGMIIIYFWIYHYTSFELRQLNILATPVHFELLLASLVLSLLLLGFEYSLNRRKI